MDIVQLSKLNALVTIDSTYNTQYVNSYINAINANNPTAAAAALSNIQALSITYLSDLNNLKDYVNSATR